jgi:hypothetical protein
VGIVRRAILTFLSLGFLTTVSVVRGDPWRFVVTGDSRGSFDGINRPILTEIANDIVRQNDLSKIDLIVFPGDLIEDFYPPPIKVQYETWMSVMQTMTDAGIRVLACRGNHDSDWLSYFGSDAYPEFKLPDNGPPRETFMTYSVDHNNAVFIALDTFGGILGANPYRINQPWLESVLSVNRQPHVFVFGHVPAFKALHEDCLDDFPRDRDRFWQTLVRYGARTYMCCHDHFFDRARIDDGDGDPDNDIQQLIVATAGGPLYPDPDYDGDNGLYTPINLYHAKQFGYIVVDVNDLDVRMTWMQRDTAALGKGTYFAADSWSYRAEARPVSFPDANLRQAVATQLGIERPTPEQMLGLTELSAGASQIRELEGLEYARNLRTADLRDNQIDSLYALLDLDQLVLLDLQGNPLSDATRCREVAAIRTLNPTAEIRIDPPSRTLVSDCAADYRDLDILSQVWGQGCFEGDGLCSLSDLDGSGAVDLEDLLVLVEYWLGTP